MNQRKHQDKDDRELLDNFYAGYNNEWLGILLERYTLLLYGVCLKYLKNEEEAKDGVQQVFLKVLHEIPKYKVTYFKSWVYMIAKNHCLMKLRHKGRYTVEINDSLLAAPHDPSGIQSAREKEQQLLLMESALEQLNAEQRQCVTLFYLEKKSYQQITEITGYDIMQVKSHIQNGKRNLRLQLSRSIKNE